VKRVKNASDPSVSGEALAFAGGSNDAARVKDGPGVTTLPGTDPSISRDFAAVLDGSRVRILARPAYAEIASFGAKGVDAVAISDTWLAYRTRIKGRDRLFARDLDGAGQPGNAKKIAAAGSPDQLSLPGLDGASLVYAVQTTKRSRIVKTGLNQMRRDVVVKSNLSLLSNPSVRGEKMLYSRGTRSGWELRIKKLKNNDFGKVLESRDKRIWSTGLGSDRAYYTVLEGSRPRATIQSVKR